MNSVHNNLGQLSGDLRSRPTLKKLPAVSPSNTKITLLAISPYGEDRQSLETILEQSCWAIQGASTFREATRILHESGPNLILCERDLPDGNWKDVFREAGALRVPPPVVVVSRQADERLWAEVLNLGCFDVLMRPFEHLEVRRVMNMAHRHVPSHSPEFAVA